MSKTLEEVFKKDYESTRKKSLQEKFNDSVSVSDMIWFMVRLICVIPCLACIANFVYLIYMLR